MTVRREIVESRSETGAWSREGPRRTGQYVEGLSGEPARLHAAVAACRLVAAAKSAIAAEVFMNNVGL